MFSSLSSSKKGNKPIGRSAKSPIKLARITPCLQFAKQISEKTRRETLDLSFQLPS